MIQIYKSMDDGIMNIEKTITEGCWVSLTAPNSAELEQVAQELLHYTSRTIGGGIGARR